MKLQSRVQTSISRRVGEVILRSELKKLGGSSQLTEALNALVKEGKLIKLGSGVFAKAQIQKDGSIKLVGHPQKVAMEVFEKLGVKAVIAGVKKTENGDLYLIDSLGHRINRKLDFGVARVKYVNQEENINMNSFLNMPKDIDLLPIKGLKEYIDLFAKAHSVSSKHSKLNDWAEAITRVAGDDVRLDETERLLMTLKKENLINGRQAARLLINYMREEAHVRPISGLSNRGLSSQP